VDLYYAGFSREEIDLMENLTDGIPSDGLEEWEPISTPRLIAVKMGERNERGTN
jgi:hypothetical protein